MVKKVKESNKEPEVIIQYGEEGEGVVDENPSLCSKVEDEKKKKIEEEIRKEVEKRFEEKEKEESKIEETKTQKEEEREEVLKKRIETPIDKNVQELLDSGRTFVDNITKNVQKNIFSSFYPFPKNVYFTSTEKDEVVVLMVRHHWSGLIKKAVLVVFALLFPFLLFTATDSWFDNTFSVVMFDAGIWAFFWMVAFTIVLDAFYKWFFEMNVITTTRIIDLDFISIMTHRLSETTFDQIQDVSHSPAGPLASFFDYGHLYIQTAGAKSEFTFDNIPRARDVQDAIWDLRYLRKRKLQKIPE